MRTTITNRMMIGASLLMMTFSFAMNANAQTCTKVPTCEELGYTRKNCGFAEGLRCPFDTSKVYCDPATSGIRCKKFDFLYSDFSCSENKISGKTIIGIVTSSNANAVSAVALKNYRTNVTITVSLWGDEGCDDYSAGGISSGENDSYTYVWRPGSVPADTEDMSARLITAGGTGFSTGEKYVSYYDKKSSDHYCTFTVVGGPTSNNYSSSERYCSSKYNIRCQITITAK